MVTGDEALDTDEPIQMTIAYDHSAAAEQAVQDVKRFHWSSQASAQVLSVVHEANLFGTGYFGADSVAGMEENYEEQAEIALARAQKQLPDLSRVIPRVEAQVIRGEHTGDSILKRADENQSHLIVIGNSGHGILSELILGSTSKYVLRHAPCSVWIARSPGAKAKLADCQLDSTQSGSTCSIG